MNDRFDSAGSFSGTFGRPVTPQTPTALSQVLAAEPVVTGDSKGKKAKEAPKIEFEGNRLGVSPMTIGLIIGLLLIAYNLFSVAKDTSWSAEGGMSTVREYKRMIRPMDLPGR